jgi:hypothetical protein
MFTILTVVAAWFSFGYSVTDIVQRYYAEKRIAEILKEVEELGKTV